MLNAKPATTRASEDELIRVLNTALVSTRAQAQRDFSQELLELMKEPGFKAMLQAVRWLSEQQSCPEPQAAEMLIQTFRKADGLWRDYLFQEGVDRIQS